MPARDALQCCLYLMYRWGHIARFRFDNGRPFGTPTLDGVSPCAAVLAALGCAVVFNRPRSPTQNAKVERNQGTTARWANVQQCADIEAFRRSLERAVIDQRERYPTRVCQGETRLATYPELAGNPRRYAAADFQAERAYRMIGQYTFARTVSAHGQLSLLGHRYQVGKQNAGTRVVARLVIKLGLPVWVLKDQVNHLVGRLLARPLLQPACIAEVWSEESSASLLRGKH